MNKLALVFLMFLFTPNPSFAQNATIYDECYRNVEEYIPGYYTSDGQYVNGYVRTDRKSVPCGSGGGYVTHGGYVSNAGGTIQRCNPNRTRFNGILGGAIAAAVSKSNAYYWSIPLGVALGVSSARVDCK